MQMRLVNQPNPNLGLPFNLCGCLSCFLCSLLAPSKWCSIPKKRIVVSTWWEARLSGKSCETMKLNHFQEKNGKLAIFALSLCAEPRCIVMGQRGKYCSCAWLKSSFSFVLLWGSWMQAPLMVRTSWFRAHLQVTFLKSEVLARSVNKLPSR